MGPFRALILGVTLGLVGCAHAPPEVVQVFDQVNQTYEPACGWSAQLSVFVQAKSADGKKVFDRLHVIHDGQQWFVTLGSGQWTVVDRPGEYWVGTNGMVFPGGKVPTGPWRVVLVTKDGQKVEASFAVPPSNATLPRRAPVVLRPVTGVPGKYRVSGWVDNTLAWFRDSRGKVVGSSRFVGSDITVPGDAESVVLYSYDNLRGEGLEAGPFLVQTRVQSADR